MNIVILIPFVVGFIALFRMPAERIFLNVYLPVLMLFPIYYFWKAPLLPPLDFSQAALVPLGIAIVVRELRGWRFSLSDVAMVLWIFSAGAADLHKGDVATARINMVGPLISCGIPYMAGKLLIEYKGLRVAVMRRMVFLMACASIIGLWEYRMGANPYMLFWSRFFPDESFAWKTQFRWGFGRVSGPYAQSELAGIVLLTGLIMTLWLARARHWERHFRYASWLPVRKSTVIAGVVSFTLFATQARGPWIGTLAALPVVSLGWVKDVRRATIITILTLGIGGAVAYTGLMAYASGNVAQSAEQENAQYRSQLITNYMPIAQAGGLWGYGVKFPKVAGQESIDNEYLFVTLTQGFVGLGCFLLLAVEAIVRLLRIAYSSRPGQDRSFAFCLLGIYAGLLFTITTVFLGSQPFEFFFLFAGWTQTLAPDRELPERPFAYVLT